MSRLTPSLVVLASLALTACGGDVNEDLKLWMKDATKDMKGRVPPLPEIKPFPVVSYDAGGKLDPFKPMGLDPEKKAVGGGTKPNFDRRKEALEAYPLESLKMVGLLERAKIRNAIIRAGTVVHLAKIGNYIGQNFGIITNISENEVRIRELVQDPAGDWVERTSTLQLQEQEATNEPRK
jgi:type IV pilus assembly protein PilP